MQGRHPQKEKITICTQNKEHLLSQIVLKDSFVGTGVPDGPQESKGIFVELTEYGKIADKYINQLNDFYENISVDDYVIMPDHIHLLLIIQNDLNGRPMAAPTISQIVNQMKGYVSKQIGQPIWQKSFFDHIIRDEKDYNLHLKYIRENPLKWYFNGEDHDDITLYE